MNDAESLAKATGSVSATYTTERRTQDGELETVSIQSFARGKSYEFRYEPVAHNARRRWINAGYQVSLIAMNNAGNFVFDVYDVKG